MPYPQTHAAAMSLLNARPVESTDEVAAPAGPQHALTSARMLSAVRTDRGRLLQLRWVSLLAMALMAENVSVSTAEPFATSSHVPHAIRLALGSLALDSLQTALETVKRVVDRHTY